MLDVYEAVTSRRAVRGFTDRQVPGEALRRVLSAAAWAPSGSDLQPWHAFVLTGEPLDELKGLVGDRVSAGDAWDEPEYEQYPPELKSPYRERRTAFGEQRYGELGVPPGAPEVRRRAAAANRECFGAPAALFCYIDRDLGRPQWADVGMYLQTVTLLLRAEGLHSCTRMAWAKYHRTVARVVSPPDDLMLFCGMAIGYEDTAVAGTRTGWAPLDGTVTFIGGAGGAHGGYARAESAATPGPRFPSTVREAGAGSAGAVRGRPRRERGLSRVAARFEDALARKIGRIVSQIGLPPGRL